MKVTYTNTRNLVIFITILVTGGLFFGLGIHKDIFAVRSDPIFARTIVSFEQEGTTTDGVTTYQYLGKRIEEKLDPAEVVEMRNDYSYTKKVGVLNAGTKEERPLMVYKGYVVPQYVKVGNSWYYRESATTTNENFSKAMNASPLASLFYSHAWALSASPIAAGTGPIGRNKNGAPASYPVQCRSTAVPAQTVPGSNPRVRAYDDPGGGPNCGGARGFMPMDTSGIPSGAVLTSATLNVPLFSVIIDDTDLGNPDSFFRLVQTSQASSVTFTTADISQFAAVAGAPDTNMDTLFYSNPSTTLVSLPLNATGLGWIARNGDTSNCGVTTGVTCFGFRIGFDVNLGGPAAGANWSATFGVGTTSIEVHYIGEPSFVPWQFQDF